MSVTVDTRTGNSTRRTVEVTIANGASTSSGVDLGGGTLLGWLNPATLTNTAFTVQNSIDGGSNYYNVASMTSVASAVSTFSAVAPSDARIAGYVRLKGASNEGGARTITLVYDVV